MKNFNFFLLPIFHTFIICLSIYFFYYLANNFFEFEALRSVGFQNATTPEYRYVKIKFNLLFIFLTLFFAVAISILTLLNIKYGIYILLAIAPLTRQVDLIGVYAGKVLPIIILLSFLLMNKFKVPIVRMPKEITIYIIILTIGLITSTLYNDSSFIPVIRQLVFFMLMYIIYVVAIMDGLSKLPYIIVIFSSFVALDIIISSILSNDFYSAFNQTGHLFNSQTAAGSILLCATPFFYLNWYKDGLKIKSYLILFIFMTFFIISAIFTGSRGSLLGILLFMFFYHTRGWSMFKFILTLLILLVLIYFISKLQFVYDVFRLDNPLSQRDILFFLGLQAVIDSPIFGIGPGEFSDLAFEFGASEGILDLVKGGVFGSSSHNVYLDAYLDAGLIGFLGLLYLYYGIIKKSNKSEMYWIRAAFIKSYIIISFFGSKIILGGAVTEGLVIWSILILMPVIKNMKP